MEESGARLELGRLDYRDTQGLSYLVIVMISREPASLRTLMVYWTTSPLLLTLSVNLIVVAAISLAIQMSR